MFRKKKAKKVVYDFPRDLKELGYQITEKGNFLTLEGEIYKFEVKDRKYNEALYEAIIELLMEWVEEKLQNELELQKKLLPISATKDDIHSKIYVSPDYLENDKMMIFIPGTANTIGCWSKRVMIDVSINDGSMISYVKRAREMGFSVIIVNPNEVFWYKGRAVHTLPKTNVPFEIIMNNESPEHHTNYVFENFVIPSSANKIFIVANSYGGHCTVDVMQNFFESLKNRVRGVEFTETTHSIDFVKTRPLRSWINKNCRNWIMSNEPLGKPILDGRFGCASYSSGAEINDFVTYEVTEKIFEHIGKRLEQLENGVTESNEEEDDEYLEDEYLAGSSYCQVIDDVQDKVYHGFGDDEIDDENAASGWR